MHLFRVTMTVQFYLFATLRIINKTRAKNKSRTVGQINPKSYFLLKLQKTSNLPLITVKYRTRIKETSVFIRIEGMKQRRKWQHKVNSSVWNNKTSACTLTTATPLRPIKLYESYKFNSTALFWRLTSPRRSLHPILPKIHKIPSSSPLLNR